MPAIATPTAPSFIRLHAERLMLGDQTVRLRGFNLGNWLLHEHYMVGLPWTGHELRRQFRRKLGEEKFRAFFDPLLDEYITDADLSFLARHGFNLLQVPFDYRHFATDHSCSGFDNDGERHLDRLVALCRRHGFFLILGLHAVPGALVRDWNAESNYGEALFWEHDVFLEQTAAIWQRIARRYAQEPVVVGYELISEPLAPSPSRLERVHARLIQAVREVDTNHILFLSGDRWNQDLAALDDAAFDDPQVMPSVHFYAATAAPFRYLTDYPGDHNGRRVDAATVREAFEARHGPRPRKRLTLLGEFGLVRQVPELHLTERLAFAPQARIYTDLLAHIEQLGLPWTMWAYKDLGVLGLVSPRSDTPWRQFLRRPDILELNRGFLGAISPAIEAAMTLSFPGLSAEEQFLFTYGARHHWDAMTLPHFIRKLGEYSAADLGAFARSWRFESCSVDEERLGVLRSAFAATIPRR